MEHDEFSRIPGSVYTKGFIKNYSELLGLDSRRLVDTFKNRMGESLTIPKRRIVSKEQEKTDAFREQELIEAPKQRLTYESRKAKRQKTMMIERFVVGGILLLMILFLGWLFFV